MDRTRGGGRDITPYGKKTMTVGDAVSPYDFSALVKEEDGTIKVWRGQNHIPY